MDDWQDTLNFVRHTAHHAVSLTTIYELLAGLAYGHEDAFNRFRDRFKLLLIGAQQTFLPLSGEFIRSRLFGLPLSRPDFDPGVLQRWLPIVLRASSRQEMENGLIELGPAENWTFGVNLKLVQGQILKGKAAYIRRLKKLRISHPEPLPIEQWAAGMVSALNLPLTLENRLKVETSLDAVYHHDVMVRRNAANQHFNFKKNSSAWLDSSQLVYLADPTFVFVTADKKLLEGLAGSTQHTRVLYFKDLVPVAKTLGRQYSCGSERIDPSDRGNS